MQAYRLGQRRNVKVYRLMSLGSIQEIQYLRQIYKLQMGRAATEGKVQNRYFQDTVETGGHLVRAVRPSLSLSVPAFRIKDSHYDCI